MTYVGTTGPASAQSSQNWCSATSSSTPSAYSSSQPVAAGRITIPVAFRNIYTPDGTGYQTEGRVRAQIDTLNAAFRRVAVRAAAAGYPGLDIDFRLVSFIRSKETSDPAGFQKCYEFTQIDPTRVLNICSEFDGGTGGQAGPFFNVVASNRALPGMVSGAGVRQEGGIITHEVGHYLDLNHTFGFGSFPGTTCSDQGQTRATCESQGDLVCDTPPTLGNQSLAFIPPPGPNSCPDNLGPGGSDLRDDVANFMDYSLDPTWNNFSVEQLLRMRRALQTQPAIANGNGRTVQIPQTLVVRPNDEVAFYDADFLLAPNARIDVQGTFNTFGATLTESSPLQGWGGIQYAAGSAGTITGGEITRVKTYGGAAVSITSASPTLRNVQITDSPCCGTDGVYVTGSASNPTIQGATIRSMSGTGITLDSYARGRFIRNLIQQNGEDGVVAGYGTAPFLSPDATINERIGNTITDNIGNGVYVGSQAYATYGWYYYGSAGYAHADGYNDILRNGLAGSRVAGGGGIQGGGSDATRRNGYYDNVGNEVEVTGSGSRASASCNYWGPGVAPPFQTLATGGGTVTLFTYLTQNPRANPTEPCQNIGSVAAAGKQGDSGLDFPLAGRGGVDELAVTLENAAGMAMNRPAEALVLLRRVVTQGTDDLAAAALAEVARIASGPQALPAARALLGEHAAGVPGRRRSAALRALVGVRRDTRDAAGALVAAQALAATGDADAAAFGSLASVYLLSEAGRMDDARAALAVVERRLPGSREARLARRSLGLEPLGGRGTTEAETPAKTDAAQTAEAALLPARPNPAGTMAVVPFRLGATSRVRLSVVDVLGREVAVLADASFEAGEHTATLDASRLSPGVYVVWLTVAGEGAVTRMTSRLTVAR